MAIYFRDRDLIILFFLREVPYCTSDYLWKFFFPSNKTGSLTRQKLSMFLKQGIIKNYRFSNGTKAYYITRKGENLALQLSWKFESIEEGEKVLKVPVNKVLNYKLFSPYYLTRNQLHHTKALLEFYYLTVMSKCFFHVVWMDNCTNRNSRLNVHSVPDFLLCNDLDSTEGRVFIEIENSKIREVNLAKKLNRLAEHDSSSIIFLCTEKSFFLNLGRAIRKILSGNVKSMGKPISFNPSAKFALNNRILIGRWIPSFKSDGEFHKLSSLNLYRFDHKIFSPLEWVNKVVDGVVQKGEDGKAIKVRQPRYYREGRGDTERRLRDIFLEAKKNYTNASERFFNERFEK